MQRHIRLFALALAILVMALVNNSSAHIDGATAVFGGTVDLDSAGITIDAGGSSTNRIKWTDGSYISSDGSDGLTVKADAGGFVDLLVGSSTRVFFNGSAFYPSPNGSIDLGTSSFRYQTLYTETVEASGNIHTDADLLVDVNAYLLSLSGSGRRYLCVENNGAITADATAC